LFINFYKYNLPTIPLTKYQEKLFNKLLVVCFTDRNLLSESEILVLEQEKEKIAGKLISDLKKTHKIKSYN